MGRDAITWFTRGVGGAVASIAEANLGSTDTAIATGVFVAIGPATVVGAVLFYLVDGDRAAAPLATVKDSWPRTTP